MVNLSASSCRTRRGLHGRLRTSERALLLAFCALLRLGASAADRTRGGARPGAAVLGRSRCAPAVANAAAEQARVPFANHGGINDWRELDDRTVLIQDINGQWYKASLMTPCIGLPSCSASDIESNPDGSFDELGAIKLRHQTCPLASLVKTGAPPKRSEPRKMAARCNGCGSAPTAPAPPLPPQRRRSAPS